MRVFALMALLALAACGTLGLTSSDPIGIGSDTDALKKSPCACGPTFYRHGQWVS
jgi:hypothetical protein